jgi:hypothetical protein
LFYRPSSSFTAEKINSHVHRLCTARITGKALKKESKSGHLLELSILAGILENCKKQNV